MPRLHVLTAVLVVILGLVLGLVGAAPAQANERRPAARLLASLPVAPEHPAGYAREKFGDWLDLNRNGCDTRQEVLIAERLAGQVRGCAVTHGRWLSSYDGITFRNPARLDIDHRVPLEEAWASGAWRWTTSTRHRYANDLGYALSLMAVSASTNRSKGDREPREWLPPLPSVRCAYIKAWIGVKYRWRLAVDSAEKSYLTRQLTRCDPLMTVPRRALVTTR